MSFDFDEVLAREGTAAIASDAWRDFLLGDVADADLPAEGADLLTMWVADMDVATPDIALDAMRARLDRRILGYTLDADDAYRAAFAAWCERRYDWSFDPEHLCIGRGVVPALIDLVGVLCAPGERIVTLTPGYHWFQEAVEKHGLELVPCALRYDDGRWELDLDGFEAAVSDPAVTLFLLCHPHNPTGRLWTDDELLAMADVCRRHGVRIVSDEIHADLLRSGLRHRPLASIAPADDAVITCLAPSKTFNLAGLLFSNVLIPDAETVEKWDHLQSGISNPLSLAGATAVYTDGDAWLDALRVHLDDNLALVAETIAARLPEARFEVPEATYLAWIDLGGHAEESTTSRHSSPGKPMCCSKAPSSSSHTAAPTCGSTSRARGPRSSSLSSAWSRRSNATARCERVVCRTVSR